MWRTGIRGILAASLAATLTGCPGLDALLLKPGGNTPGGQTQDQVAARTKLGNLEFKALSAETSRRLDLNALSATSPAAIKADSRNSAPQSGNVADSAAPKPAAGAPSSGAPISGGGGSTGYAAPEMASPAVMPGYTGGPAVYSYGAFFGSPFGTMKLASITEAVAPGSAGGWSALQGDVIGPVLADWGGDGALISSNVTLDADGNPIQGTPNYPGEIGWRFAYAAPSIREVLYFLITPGETRVVRMRWTPVAIDPRAVQVDTKAAIETVKAAVRDAKFKPREAFEGDGFFYPRDDVAVAIGGGAGGAGGSSGGVAKAEPAMAVAPPRLAVDMPAPSPDSKPQVYYDWQTREEFILELTPGGRWTANLQVIGKYTLWELSYAAYYSGKDVTPMPLPLPEPVPMSRTGGSTGAVSNGVSPGSTDAVSSVVSPDSSDTKPADAHTTYVPQPYSYTNDYIYALVDASTGAIFRLRRPSKITVTPVPMNGK
ncbi:MAG: hypothetical protein FJZ00_01125 [Candidatus Sericytochromatia bacterium]|uniref:Lipoprotein n=1 Tax=Candidatus Tanganyikabacteria bacterium TaxID=2961651 RepID=A0A938BM96_9BACT|nr:hypothetical protein [Candidatus Tanganyikabacteria bacterium]